MTIMADDDVIAEPNANKVKQKYVYSLIERISFEKHLCLLNIVDMDLLPNDYCFKSDVITT